MSRDIAIAIALGALSALCMLSMTTGTLGAVILTYLAPLPLFVAGLMFGVPKLLVAGLTGTAGSAILGFASLTTYGLVVAVPAVLLTRQALLSRAGPQGTVEWYPPGMLLVWLSGLAAAYLLGAVAWFSGTPGGLPGRLQPVLAEAIGAMQGQVDGPGMSDQVAAALARAMPAVMAAIWMVVTAINGMLAQGLAVRFGRNVRPSPSLAEVELPRWLAAAMAVAVAASFLSGTAGFAAETLAVILAVPFFFQGLGLVHVVAAKTVNPAVMLVGFYILLIVFGGLVVVIAALGLIEQWARMRRRLTGSGGGDQEDV